MHSAIAHLLEKVWEEEKSKRFIEEAMGHDVLPALAAVATGTDVKINKEKHI